MSKRWEELDQDEYMKYLDQAAYAIEHNLAKGDAVEIAKRIYTSHLRDRDTVSNSVSASLPHNRDKCDEDAS